jgi:hypothetical protein
LSLFFHNLFLHTFYIQVWHYLKWNSFDVSIPPLNAHYDCVCWGAEALGTIPNNFPISIGLFISQGIELFIVIAPSPWALTTAIWYGRSTFSYCSDSLYFLKSLRFFGYSPIRGMDALWSAQSYSS